MHLLIDTRTGICHIILETNSVTKEYQWEANRELAKGLLSFIRDCLADNGADFNDLTGIGACSGPGSFTGLRIGITVANTLAEALDIPICGASGDNWREKVEEKLASGENEKIVMPEYGAEANITTPRK